MSLFICYLIESTAAAAVKDKEKKNDNYNPKEGIVIKEVT